MQSTLRTALVSCVCALVVWAGTAATRGQAGQAAAGPTTGLRPNKVNGLGDGEPPVGAPVAKYYTEEQAARGKTQFIRNCAECHTAPPLVTRDMLPPEAGFYRTEHSMLPLNVALVRK